MVVEEIWPIIVSANSVIHIGGEGVIVAAILQVVVTDNLLFQVKEMGPLHL